MANFLERTIALVSPGRAAARARARSVFNALSHYEAASTGRRSKSWRPNGLDADGAAARRDRLANIGRDMVRNSPIATRAVSVISNNVVGDGIIPKIEGSQAAKKRGLALIEAHLDTTAIDADGVLNLYGLQKLAMNSIVDSGEVLIRRRIRRASDGYPLPFQLQVLEPDFLDTTKDGEQSNGNLIVDGIEYNMVGKRVAYHLFDQHPGSLARHHRYRVESKPVPASEILHVFRPDRPGQKRGVSWFSPVARTLQDMVDHQDAQLMRQKIAACFAAFRTNMDGDPLTEGPVPEDTLQPGIIETLAPGEDIRFSDPPSVEGYTDFQKSVMRSVAAGMGVTYEALSGDLSEVNFSSARMGRMEMDRNISSWQWLMLIPQMMDGIGRWFLEAWEISDPKTNLSKVKIKWVPPRRVLIDPTKEVPALRDEVSAGFNSRSNVIRTLGYDPETVMAEIVSDNAFADENDLEFDSDGRVKAQPTPQAAPETEEQEESDDE